MSEAALYAHAQTGETHLCRAWAVTRSDGVIYGFTDHDLPLEFEGITFKPDSGLTAKTLVQSTGLAVDNSEAIGALSDAAITEADIRAGRFDGAEVRTWMVNWSAPEVRSLLFKGEIGEVRRGGGAFTAELRGITEALNQPQGRVYQRPCSAILGDEVCKFALDQDGYFAQAPLVRVVGARKVSIAGLAHFQVGWFARGVFLAQTGAAAGLKGLIKTDVLVGDVREVELWEPLPGLAEGDEVRLEAGCDKRAATCQVKFNNFLNFQGFPHIPGEDWLASYPVSGKTTVSDGPGSLFLRAVADGLLNDPGSGPDTNPGDAGEE